MKRQGRNRVETGWGSHSFNMIEVVVALIVVVIGIVGVMSLFPSGLEANRDSVARSNASDAADQFLHTMASAIKTDWAVVNAIPDAKPSIADDNLVWSDESLVDNSYVDISFSAVNSSDTFDPDTHQDGVFLITQRTPGGGDDFKGVLRVWKTLTEIPMGTLSGDIMPWGIGDRSYHRGQTYTLKYTAPSAIMGMGNFGALNLNASGASSGGGANVYRGHIELGYHEPVLVGDLFYPETGNMAGPTKQGVTSRLASGRLAQFVRIPVVQGWGGGSSSQVEVLGFLPFEVLAVRGNGVDAAEVDGIYIGPEGGLNPSGVADEPAMEVVLKAEVSWPADVPYSHRSTAVFSLDVFRPGKLTTWRVGTN